MIVGLRKKRSAQPTRVISTSVGGVGVSGSSRLNVARMFRPTPEFAGLPAHNPLHCAQFDAPHPELPWWITAAAEPTRSAPPGPSPLARRAHTAIATAIAAHSFTHLQRGLGNAPAHQELP